MSALPLTRRAALAGVAASAGALVATNVSALSANLATPNLDGAAMIAIQAAIQPSGVGILRMAALDSQGRVLPSTGGIELATEGSTPETLALATGLARRAVARAWNVPATECLATGSSIRHAASGRRIGFVIWIDYA